MKIVKWAIVAVVVLVVLGLAVFWFALDRIVRRTVETQATASLQTQTTLGAASVAPVRGKVALSDLKISSPPGYSADHIFTLGDVNVAVSYGELRQDPIRVESISLKDPVITIEQKDLKTNIQALMDRIPKGPETPASGEERPMHLVISTLTVENPTVVLRPGLPGLPQELKLSLPTLTMKDVGQGEGANNGAAIKDVVMLVLTDVAAKAADSDKLPPELRQLLNVDVKQLTARLKDELNVQVEKITSDLTKKLGDNLGSAVTDLIKHPEGSATTQPAPSLEQSLGGLLNRSTKKSAPTTRPASKKK